MAEMDMEKEIVEYHKMEKLLEGVIVQLNQAKAQKAELERALESINKSSGDVYKAVGGFFIKVEREKAIEDIKHTLELLDITIKKLQDQQESLTNKYQRIIKDLEEKMGGARGGGGA